MANLNELASTWMQFQRDIVAYNVRVQALETSVGLTPGDLPGFEITPNNIDSMMLNLNNVEGAIINMEARLNTLQV